MRGRRQSYQESVGESGHPPPPEKNPPNAAQPRDGRRRRETAASAMLRRRFRSEEEQRQEKRDGEGERVVSEQQAEGFVCLLAAAVTGGGFGKCERNAAAVQRRIAERRRPLAPAAVGDFPATVVVEESVAAGARRHSGVTPATICTE